MDVIFTLEEVPEKIKKSIFLAGPTSRTGGENSWRKAALQILEDKGFDGTVFVPEARNWEKFNPEYDEQVSWEDKTLNIADCILFWIPRDLETLPAFTTNDEWGFWKSSGKVVLGAPPQAEKVSYQKFYAKEFNVPFSTSLTETIQNALDQIGDGAERVGGERFVPYYIWKTDVFQQWYKAQTDAGNKLEWAKLLFNFRPRNKSFVFLWVLHAHVYVAAEDRIKSNELVLSRTNISSVCMMYNPSDKFEDCEVVLIKEFRTPAATNDAYIRELPGGSSTKDRDPLLVAIEEIEEETGFTVKQSQLREVGTRQLSGTLSAHTSTLYAVDLTKDEIQWFKDQKGEVHGNVEDSERCYIEVVSVKDLLENNLVDWTTLGQILAVATPYWM